MGFKTCSEWANEHPGQPQDTVPELVHFGSHERKAPWWLGRGYVVFTIDDLSKSDSEDGVLE